MLPEKELQHMRDAVAALYPNECNILSATSVSDGEGGYTQTWGTADSSVCRLDINVDKERLTDGSLRTYNFYTLAMPWDTEITEANRVEIGGYTYLVSGTDNQQDWQIEKVVRVERI